MGDKHSERYSPRDVKRPYSFVERLGPAGRIGTGKRESRPPSAVRQAFRNRRVHAVQRETSVGQPLLKVCNCGDLVIVEVGPRGEDLDRLETMGRYFGKMRAGQPMS